MLHNQDKKIAQLFLQQEAKNCSFVVFSVLEYSVSEAVQSTAFHCTAIPSPTFKKNSYCCRYSDNHYCLQILTDATV
jgi:hypothetical protein